MRGFLLPLRATIVGCVGLCTASAGAQDPPAPPPQVTDAEAGPTMEGEIVAPEGTDESKRKMGWSPGIAIGATFNLVNTQSVVGQPDGTTLNIGGGLDASLEFNEGMHEWRNMLLAAAGTTRTPAIDEFVKTNDGLAFESIYLIHVIESFGPFARFGLNTQMFPATDIRPAAVDYVVKNVDGTTTNFTGRRLALTGPFEPLTLRESLGVFWQPLRSDRISLETRVGFGAIETFASGLAVTDDSATPELEVTELDDSYMIGGEGVLNVWGFFDNDKRISYIAGVTVLAPFVTSTLPEGDDRNLGELINFEGVAGLNAKLFDWAAVSYRLNVTRQPLLIDEFQISNMLLLTIGAAWGSKAPEPEPPPPCDCSAQPVVLEPKSSTEAPTNGPLATPPTAPAPLPEPAQPAPEPDAAPDADPDAEPEPEPEG